MDDIFSAIAGSPDSALVGDGSPLVVEYCPPPELIESTLLRLDTVLPDKVSRLSNPLPILALLVRLPSDATLGRLPSSHTLVSRRSH